MKKILFIFAIVISGISVSAQTSDSIHNLIDFYKAYWCKDSTGKHYVKRDLDGYAISHKNFNINYNCMKGMTMEQIRFIFGDPDQKNVNGSITDYTYYYTIEGKSDSKNALYIAFYTNTGIFCYFDATKFRTDSQN